jgi:D-amino-acid oxidase
MTTNETIVVVGGGVSGLTTGVVLLEAGLSVRLIAKEVPARTSRGAGAIWSPYFVEPWADVREWSGTGVRITDIYGERLTADGTAVLPDVAQPTGVQFARH